MRSVDRAKLAVAKHFLRRGHGAIQERMIFAQVPLTGLETGRG